MSATSAELLVPIGAVIALCAGAIAYGMQRERIDSAHERLTALEHRVTAILLALEHKIDSVIKLAERIDERTHRKERDE